MIIPIPNFVTAFAASSAIFASTFVNPPTAPPSGLSVSPTALISPPCQLYSTAYDIPANKIADHSTISGKVVKIIDGDTIRIRHNPFCMTSDTSKWEGPMYQNTISVRLYGVDAPEIAKKGFPSMPKAEAARDFTKAEIDNKIVNVKLLRRDQYGRIVGQVTLGQEDMTLELAKRGFATLYTGGGAEYDGHKDDMINNIEYAKKNKLGIWENGPENVMSPAEYKRKMKAAMAAADMGD